MYHFKGKWYTFKPRIALIGLILRFSNNLILYLTFDVWPTYVVTNEWILIGNDLIYSLDCFEQIDMQIYTIGCLENLKRLWEKRLSDRWRRFCAVQHRFGEVWRRFRAVGATMLARGVLWGSTPVFGGRAFKMAASPYPPRPALSIFSILPGHTNLSSPATPLYLARPCLPTLFGPATPFYLAWPYQPVWPGHATLSDQTFLYPCIPLGFM